MKCSGVVQAKLAGEDAEIDEVPEGVPEEMLEVVRVGGDREGVREGVE